MSIFSSDQSRLLVNATTTPLLSMVRGRILARYNKGEKRRLANLTLVGKVSSHIFSEAIGGTDIEKFINNFQNPTLSVMTRYQKFVLPKDSYTDSGLGTKSMFKAFSKSDLPNIPAVFYIAPCS
jgi:hypothetical protein